MIKYWLQVFRAQTAPATVFTILVPYLLAGGRDPSMMLIIFVLGTLTHYMSFGHNSLMDYWYDIHDPNKSHHPLVNGTLSIETAHKLIHYGMVLLSVAWIVVAVNYSPNPLYAIIALFLYYGWGHAYNDGLDKNTSHSWISISLCFVSLATFGWLLASTRICVVFWLVLLWAFLTIFYQIAWEGNLKDLWNPAEKLNLLKRLGVRLEPYEDHEPVEDERYWIIRVPKYLDWAMYLARVLINSVVILAIAVNMGYSLSWNMDNVLFTIMFCLTFIVKTMSTTLIHETIKKPFRRRELLEAFGEAEAFEFFHFMTLLWLARLGWMWILLLVYGLGYFVLMNKLLWKSRFGPRV